MGLLGISGVIGLIIVLRRPYLISGLPELIVAGSFSDNDRCGVEDHRRYESDIAARYFTIPPTPGVGPRGICTANCSRIKSGIDVAYTARQSVYVSRTATLLR